MGSPVLGELLFDDSADLFDDSAERKLRKNFAQEAHHDETLRLHPAEPTAHEVELRVGIELTESFAMTPAASVSGLYMAHPESVYFAVGRIERDQVEDYAKRKGMELRVAERWLGPILNYDPGEVEVEAA